MGNCEPVPNPTRPCDSCVHTMHFPMYVVKVSDFLEMEGPPEAHGALWQRGMLRAWEPGIFTIFVSHQWLGLAHPDPQGVHCALLRETLQNIIDGTVSAETDIVSQNRGGSRHARQSPEGLAQGYLFLDWFAIPQITARTAGVNEEDTKSDAAKAVQSIPAYVEVSDLFIALVPEVQHHDRKTHCNYTSWLARGWCRAELWCRLLSIKPETRVILIHSTREVKFMFPLDWQASAIVDADFTVEADRSTVAKLGEVAVEEKIRQLRQHGPLHVYRFFVANRPKLLGISTRWDEETFLKNFEFKDWRQAGQETSGMNGLLCATFAGNVEVIRRMVEHRADVNQNIEGLGELGYYPSQSVLMAAAKSRQPAEVLTALLELRADVNHQAGNGTTPISLARSPQQVRVLHEAKANLNNLLTDIGRSPLIGCTTMAATDTVQALLEERCDAASCSLVIPIIFSRGNPHVHQSLRLLLSHKADPNGELPMRGGAYFDCCLSLAKVKLLGWERSGLNTQHFASLLGCTPLHSAAYIGSTATVKLLLEFQVSKGKTITAVTVISCGNGLGMWPEDVARHKAFTHLLPELCGWARVMVRLVEAPSVARASERHEWEYSQRQHQAALRNIQKQAGHDFGRASSAQAPNRRSGDSYLRRVHLGRENRKLVEKLDSIARGYGAWDPRAPPSKKDYRVVPGPFVPPRDQLWRPELDKKPERVRSLNEAYRFRMQKSIMHENEAMVNRILAVGPTFDRKCEARDFSRHKRTAQSLQRFSDRSSLPPPRPLPKLRVPRPSSSWTPQGLEGLLVPGDLCRSGSCPAMAERKVESDSYTEPSEMSPSTQISPGRTSHGAGEVASGHGSASPESSLGRSAFNPLNDASPSSNMNSTEAASPAGGSATLDPARTLAPIPSGGGSASMDPARTLDPIPLGGGSATMDPARTLDPLPTGGGTVDSTSMDPSPVGLQRDRMDGWEKGEDTARRKWLSSDVAGPSNATPASPSSNADLGGSDVGYSADWDEFSMSGSSMSRSDSPKSQSPSAGARRPRRERNNGNLSSLNESGGF
ncbi:unnamed protein product [Effrenium voratum]|uniref:Uncharacterized protein n=1 Tax=Effrenium voratum TaxID=2562239 RepID=A0AA36J619_9DINO|nr:unnamed protein product [Effrenium voratum]